ncbi:hypothetical protein M436DRAFT_68446 [Aureobasidium namibiae CBS 147.97]|uniref:Uncharacterized protein n=1 Tax=Aureobasidium namibiae CBS 147.97 TaxID=1043004 RepID=A0A074W4U0_9PEZI
MIMNFACLLLANGLSMADALSMSDTASSFTSLLQSSFSNAVPSILSARSGGSSVSAKDVRSSGCFVQRPDWMAVRETIEQTLTSSPFPTVDIEEMQQYIQHATEDAIRQHCPKAKLSAYGKRWWTPDLTALHRNYTWTRNLARSRHRQGKRDANLEVATKLGTVPVGAESESVTYDAASATTSVFAELVADVTPDIDTVDGNTLSVLKRTACQAKPASLYIYVPEPDTPEFFVQDTTYSEAANNAETPAGWQRTFQTLRSLGTPLAATSTPSTFLTVSPTFQFPKLVRAKARLVRSPLLSQARTRKILRDSIPEFRDRVGVTYDWNV